MTEWWRTLLWGPPEREWNTSVEGFHLMRSDPESYEPSDVAWAAYRAGLLAVSGPELRRQARILRRETAQMQSVII